MLPPTKIMPRKGVPEMDPTANTNTHMPLVLNATFSLFVNTIHINTGVCHHPSFDPDQCIGRKTSQGRIFRKVTSLRKKA